MSQLLLRELDIITKEVDATIANLFANKEDPKIIYDASKHLITAGGKRLRPFLTLKACEIVGGRRDVAFPIAASIELIHNFSIIHDDIMDKDDNRRGVPTVHIQWGIPIAITAGDMLFAKAYESIFRCTSQISTNRILKIATMITDTTIRICEGQASDILFENRRDISEKEYFNMVYKKTAVLLETAAKTGVLAGKGTSLQAKRLGNLARYAGLAFQMVDDVLGLTADEKKLGKPIGSDIRDGKSTILIIHALAHADVTQQKQILSILGDKEAKNDQIRGVIQTIQSLGSIDYAMNKAKAFISKAKAQLISFPSSQSKDILIDLCDYIISRNY